MHEDGTYTCQQVGLLQAYISVEIVIVLFTVFVLIAILVLSFRGSMIQIDKRRHVVPLWVVNMILMGLDFIWVILGSVWTFGYGLQPECREPQSHKLLISLLITAVVGQWFMLFVLLTLLYCIYTRVGNVYELSAKGPKVHRRASRRMSIYRQASEIQKRVWEQRCQFLSCRCFSCSKKNSLENNFAFTEISQLLVRYFGDFDLVPTDIAAGLILLRRMYEAKKKKAKSPSGLTAVIHSYLNMRRLINHWTFSLFRMLLVVVSEACLFLCRKRRKMTW